ncbi:coiled-coil domain-containing protein 160 isoform X2 [Engraulis encrasicolus]
MEPENDHWIEVLFKPHFSVEEATKTIEQIARQNQASDNNNADHSVPKCLRTPEGKEIYQRVLRERQQREEQLLREKLAKRLSLVTTAVPGPGPKPASWATKHQSNSTEQEAQSQSQREEERQGSECIWNKQDLATLCATMDTIERDRRRLKLQLGLAQAEVRTERGERKRLRGLLDESERQLAAARQEVTRWKLRCEAQLADSKAKDAQVQALTDEVKRMAEETACRTTGEQEARQEVREANRKCSDLRWELETLREQQRVEERRLEAAARVEEDSEVFRLTQELVEVRAELKAEQESHARSHTALEILRKHFTKSS